MSGETGALIEPGSVTERYEALRTAALTAAADGFRHVSITASSRRKCSTSNNGPTLRRVPAIGGSNRANDPASASSAPESFNASLRPMFATTR